MKKQLCMGYRAAFSCGKIDTKRFIPLKDVFLHGMIAL